MVRSVSRKWKTKKSEKDVVKSLIGQKVFKENFAKDRKLRTKWQIEDMMTSLAEAYFDYYDSRICWGAIVQALKSGNPPKYILKDLEINDIKHREDPSALKGNRRVTIKTADIEKYRQYTVDDVESVRKSIRLRNKNEQKENVREFRR